MGEQPIKLICVAGARPNFMKLAPLLRLLRADPEFSPILVHTGQHYDDQMSGKFFRDLQMPSPDHNLDVRGGSHAQQTGEIMKRFEPVLLKEKPDGVLVVGDVNSTLACALVASKLQVPVIHAEAGLRSFDRTMPEEINRVLTDALSELLLITEDSATQNLLAEGISPDRIHMVGNLMIDSLRRHLDACAESDITARLGIEGKYGVITLHRPNNVDNPEQLAEIIQALNRIAEELPLYFPVHPRTRTTFNVNNISVHPEIRLIEPLGYLDFLSLISRSFAVFTDSGGIQEETTVLGIPCLTLRNNTERPITVVEGTNILAGTHEGTILGAWRELLRRPKNGRIPRYWDGRAAERCVGVLKEYFSQSKQGTGIDLSIGVC